MKKLIALMAAAVTSVLLSTAVYAAEGVIYEGQTFVPLRGAFEELGFEVEWKQSEKSADIKNEEYLLRVMEDVDVFYIVGSGSINSPKPLRIDDRLYIPLRAIGDAIGADISWNGDLKMAHISYNGKDSYIKCTPYIKPTEQKKPGTRAVTITEDENNRSININYDIDVNSLGAGVEVGKYEVYPDTNIPEFSSVTGQCSRGNSNIFVDSKVFEYTFLVPFEDIMELTETKYTAALRKIGYTYDAKATADETQNNIVASVMMRGPKFFGPTYVYKNSSGKTISVAISDRGYMFVSCEN